MNSGKRICPDCEDEKFLTEFRKGSPRCISCAKRRYQAGDDRTYLKIVSIKEKKFISQCLKCGIKVIASSKQRLCGRCRYENSIEEDSDIYN